MERLKERIRIAEDALRTFDEILEEPIQDEIHRDAAIQRFEYSFEAVTKAVQRYLQIKEGLVVGSPKSVVRNSFQVGLIGEAETEQALLMVDDRKPYGTHVQSEACSFLDIKFARPCPGC